MACETAGSLTPSADAAALTLPSRATRTKALSCVNVTSEFSPSNGLREGLFRDCCSAGS
jgi:hypothetical protein